MLVTKLASLDITVRTDYHDIALAIAEMTVSEIYVTRYYTAMSTGKDPLTDIIVTWSMPLSVVVPIDNQRFKCIGFYCKLEARGCATHEITFVEDTVIDVGNRTVSNVLDNGISRTWNINGLTVVYEKTYNGGDHNEHFVSLTISVTDTAVVFTARARSYGEEDDNSYASLTFNVPGTLKHELTQLN